MHDILDRAEQTFRIPTREITGNRRTGTILRARQAVCYAARRKGYSLQEIGQALGRRHHTSIMYSVERAELLARADAAYALDLAGLL
jgi:chromosomal replication initiator protein